MTTQNSFSVPLTPEILARVSRGKVRLGVGERESERDA